MRELLSKESGKDWNAWAAVAGKPYGSFGLSTSFENSLIDPSPPASNIG